MGNLVSQAANGIGNVLGNAFGAPFKNVFGASCEEVCEGPWDVGCFIEHLCVSNLVKFLLIAALCYMILLFFYLLFKLGVCQCIGKSLCKMCWAGFATYFHASCGICRFLWHKLMDTKRVYRGGGGRRYRPRRHRLIDQDLEAQFSPASEERSKHHHHHHHHQLNHASTSSRNRKSLVYPSSSSHRRQRLVKLRRRGSGKLSFRVHASTPRLRRRSSRHLQREDLHFKRQRLG